MFENIGHFFKRMVKEPQKELGSKDAAKERLHLVLMQDRANVSADFLELMKQEIIDVIKKYIVVDEDLIDVRLTNVSNDDGSNGAPSLYANIPIVNIKNEMMAEKIKDFEGVDFNKEMGINVKKDKKSSTKDKVKEKEDKSTIELPEKTIEPDIKMIDDDETKEIFEEVDEDDDDDVTFDDLLKAAEAADKMNSSKPSSTKTKTASTTKKEEVKLAKSQRRKKKK